MRFTETYSSNETVLGSSVAPGEAMAPWAEAENPDDGLTCRIGPRQSSATSNGREIYGKHIQNHFIGFACNRAVVLVAGTCVATVLFPGCSARSNGSRCTYVIGRRREAAVREQRGAGAA